MRSPRPLPTRDTISLLPLATGFLRPTGLFRLPLPTAISTPSRQTIGQLSRGGSSPVGDLYPRRTEVQGRRKQISSSVCVAQTGTVSENVKAEDLGDGIHSLASSRSLQEASDGDLWETHSAGELWTRLGEGLTFRAQPRPSEATAIGVHEAVGSGSNQQLFPRAQELPA
ncbi:unnamed protein product [Protopolystoma xenopodis]|uniref:Uncharacterized protein n=1 Tax=Protopolystoma xenopodis TaxID=117903 RepID=A0A3S5CIS8_9PLAT|nr:unnamed protein product [Protopolystoma xenopodis]